MCWPWMWPPETLANSSSVNSRFTSDGSAAFGVATAWESVVILTSFSFEILVLHRRNSSCKGLMIDRDGCHPHRRRS